MTKQRQSDLDHRYEILFLYEVKDNNPNGDPLDENRPRTDPETGVATVTDVRIKRTVRDYWLAQEPDEKKRLDQGIEVLVRDTRTAEGLSRGEDRAGQFIGEAKANAKKGAERDAVQAAILQHCIDARVFGAALPLGKDKPSVQLTGPAQLSAFNRSLHRVAPLFVQQTAAYASKVGVQQKSFAERWLLPYALIAVYGVVNEAAARTTGMTQEDLRRLLEGLWHGTAELNSHSKIGHQPLLLLLFKHRPGRRLGALAQRLRLINNEGLSDTALRSTRDYRLDLSELKSSLSACPSLLSTEICHDPRLRCLAGEQTGLADEVLGDQVLTLNALAL